MKRHVGVPVLVCLLGVAGAMLSGPAAHATTAAAGSGQASTTTLTPGEFGSRLLARIDNRRIRHGCRVFRVDPALLIAAQRHSEAMSANRELSHRLAGEPDLGVRVAAAGYTSWRMLAENLAWGQPGPRAVFRAWLASPGHRANLDNCRLRDIGLAVVILNGRPWVTADFGRRHT